jgi:hypothetical protein
VFAHLAAELGTGDIAVIGAESYANLHTQLMSWSECEPLVGEYCAQAGIPDTATGYVAAWKRELSRLAAQVDAGYPDNADLIISEGHPVLKRRAGKERRASALALEAAVHQRLPQRDLLEILTRTAYLTGWARHFGPASGSDPNYAIRWAGTCPPRFAMAPTWALSSWPGTCPARSPRVSWPGRFISTAARTGSRPLTPM